MAYWWWMILPLCANPTGPINLIVIGCSTGGPAALQSILPHLPASLNVPVIVIQHMPVGFTKSLAERFNSVCSVPVKEAEDGEVLHSGTVYIAPAGFQTLLKRQGTDVHIQLTTSTTLETRFHPSVDVTLFSVSTLYREHLLTVILTGMGNDGTLGCKDVKRYGGTVLIQSEDTCVVNGMPKSVFEAGFADRQVPLDSIAESIQAMIRQ